MKQSYLVLSDIVSLDVGRWRCPPESPNGSTVAPSDDDTRRGALSSLFPTGLLGMMYFTYMGQEVLTMFWIFDTTPSRYQYDLLVGGTSGYISRNDPGSHLSSV